MANMAPCGKLMQTQTLNSRHQDMHRSRQEVIGVRKPGKLRQGESGWVSSHVRAVSKLTHLTYPYLTILMSLLSQGLPCNTITFDTPQQPLLSSSYGSFSYMLDFLDYEENNMKTMQSCNHIDSYWRYWTKYSKYLSLLGSIHRKFLGRAPAKLHEVFCLNCRRQFAYCHMFWQCSAHLSEGRPCRSVTSLVCRQTPSRHTSQYVCQSQSIFMFRIKAIHSPILLKPGLPNAKSRVGVERTTTFP